MNKIFYLALISCCLSCNIIKTSSYNPSVKLSPDQLRRDFTVLNNALRSNHPSLYWYASKDSIDNIFTATYNSLTDSLTEPEFKKKIAWAINFIHCGHTSVRSSKNYSRFYKKQKIKGFPLFLKVWKDSAVVIQNFSKEDSTIKRGTSILGINGVAIKSIIDSIGSLISTDGYSNIFKYQLISFNFPAFYRNAYIGDSVYSVDYLDSLGSQKQKILRNVEIRTNVSNVKKQITEELRLRRKQLREITLSSERNMEVDTPSNSAILSVNTFSKGKLIRFYRKSFKKIRKKNIKNVVLDLRLNTGGSVITCTRLTQYLINRPFHVADTVAAYTRSFPYKKYFASWLLYWISMHTSGKKLSDGRIHFRYFERHTFKPKDKNHFDGDVYILTGGFTFSAATLVASHLKGQANVKIVGEETGGGSYGNSSILLPTVVLPNSSLRVTLPLFRMVLNKSRPKNGRGIFPDIEVSPSSDAIKRNVDPKIEKVLTLLKTIKD